MKAAKKNINGILLFDKPEGLSSNQAMQKVRWLYLAEKAGHTGNLDPMATGVLPICFGEATKFSQVGLDADKTYRAVLKLGEMTTTGDREGDIIAQAPVPTITEAMLAEIIQKFTGTISQVPPMYSALKKDGVPLYRLARQGIEVERAAREVSIYQLQLQKIQADILQLEVCCSKGTYVRTLAEDIGQYLGCGAHLIELRRTVVGQFSGPLVNLDQLQAMDELTREALLLPEDALLHNVPIIEVTQEQRDKLLQGQSVSKENLQQWTEVRLYCEEKFFGLGEFITANVLKPKRLCKTT